MAVCTNCDNDKKLCNYTILKSNGKKKNEWQCIECRLSNTRSLPLIDKNFTLILHLKMKLPTSAQISFLCSDHNMYMPVDVANLIVDYYEKSTKIEFVHKMNRKIWSYIEHLLNRSYECRYILLDEHLCTWDRQYRIFCMNTTLTKDIIFLKPQEMLDELARDLLYDFKENGKYFERSLEHF
jgi:hypothetical protein